MQLTNDDEPDYHSDGSTELNVEDLSEVRHLRSRQGQQFVAIYKHPHADFGKKWESKDNLSKFIILDFICIRI